MHAFITCIRCLPLHFWIENLWQMYTHTSTLMFFLFRYKIVDAFVHLSIFHAIIKYFSFRFATLLRCHNSERRLDGIIDDYCILTHRWIRIFNLNKRRAVCSTKRLVILSSICLFHRLGFKLMKKPQSRDTNVFVYAGAAAVFKAIDVIINPMNLNWSVGQSAVERPLNMMPANSTVEMRREKKLWNEKK